MMLTEATESLIAVALDRSKSAEEMNAVAEPFLERALQASPDESQAAMKKLSENFGGYDAIRGSYLALVCGALVEKGCDASVIVEPLIEQLKTLLDLTIKLIDVCEPQMPEPKEDENPAQVFGRELEKIASTMPTEAIAWQAIETYWRPVIAVFSRCPEARDQARPLRDLATRVAAYNEAGHWLRLMLTVLNDEPMVVIEPSTQTGVLARASGIVENFQLNVLIMDAFPSEDPTADRRVAEEVARLARGEGPQMSGDTVTGVWNLYTWRALQSDLQLPDPNDMGVKDDWIWNEGSLEDIPVLDDRRVVLLGPASYPRSWRSQRMFEALPARFDVEAKLSEDEVNDWLKRMVAAKDAS